MTETKLPKRCPIENPYGCLDCSDYDNEGGDILLGLTRWGDLQFPSRLIGDRHG